MMLLLSLYVLLLSLLFVSSLRSSYHINTKIHSSSSRLYSSSPHSDRENAINNVNSMINLSSKVLLSSSLLGSSSLLLSSSGYYILILSSLLLLLSLLKYTLLMIVL